MGRWHLQLIITLPLLVIFTLIYSVASWFTLIFLCHPIELAIGLNIPLVGESGSIDPGAIILSFIYCILSTVLSEC